jgi:hypothetical protein
VGDGTSDHGIAGLLHDKGLPFRGGSAWTDMVGPTG